MLNNFGRHRIENPLGANACGQKREDVAVLANPPTDAGRENDGRENDGDDELAEAWTLHLRHDVAGCTLAAQLDTAMRKTIFNRF